MTAPVPVSQPFGFGGAQGSPVIIPPSSLSGGGGPVLGWALQLPLPEVYPLPDALAFNPLGSKSTAAAESNVVIPNVNFAVPVGQRAVVVGVALYITNMLTTTNVTWSVRVNGVPAAGYAGITIFPRSDALATNTFDIPIRVVGPATIDVVYTNTDGGSYVVGASLSGWSWATTSDQRWKAAGL